MWGQGSLSTEDSRCKDSKMRLTWYLLIKKQEREKTKVVQSRYQEDEGCAEERLGLGVLPSAVGFILCGFPKFPIFSLLTNSCLTPALSSL